jgi:hypothetical protein
MGLRIGVHLPQGKVVVNPLEDIRKEEPADPTV